MRLAALLVLAVSLLAGCGGNDEEREAFTASANEVCRQYSADLRALPVPRSYQQLLGYVDDLERLTGERLRGLQALTPPEEVQEDFERMLAQLKRTQALFPGLLQAATLGQPAQIRAVLDEAGESDAQAGKIGAELGLDDCAGTDQGGG